MTAYLSPDNGEDRYVFSDLFLSSHLKYEWRDIFRHSDTPEIPTCTLQSGGECLDHYTIKHNYKICSFFCNRLLICSSNCRSSATVNLFQSLNFVSFLAILLLSLNFLLPDFLLKNDEQEKLSKSEPTLIQSEVRTHDSVTINAVIMVLDYTRWT